MGAVKPQTGQVFRHNQIYLNGIVVNGEKTLDMMIPGTKVGYIIGKGGDMIRNLQVKGLGEIGLIIENFYITGKSLR